MPHAIVTGASSGLGYEFARQLAKKGFDITGVARRESRLNKLREEIETETGSSFTSVVADLQNNRSVELIKNAFRDDTSVFINNAGLGIRGAFCEMSEENIHTMIQVNLSALTDLFLMATKRFVNKTGENYILNVASVAGFSPVPWFAVYGATKSYVRSLSLAVAEELKNTHTSISVLSPGPVKTEFFKDSELTTLHKASVLWSTPEEVVRKALRGLFSGKKEIITGNIFMMQKFFSDHFPDPVTVKLAGKIFRD
ncbi:MAG: SDR family NAD(P)-dependent oxidoreductase [Deltaproteobacteria bacterium]|nr:SDR family NAD(P)-dependent oxidoreductase [Deltaproteobacteria bacterium]